MSWYNPDKSEAQEGYYSSKRKYDAASEQKRSSEIAEESYRAQRSSAKSEIASCKKDKINFEKRIKDIEKVIGCFTGASFFNDIPSEINQFNSSSKKADNSYRNCIKTADIQAANLSEVFRAKSVEEDNDTSTALSELQNEKNRLEQEVANLKAQLQSLSNIVDTLSSNIRACDAEQARCTRQMFASSFDMNHYRKHM